MTEPKKIPVSPDATPEAAVQRPIEPMTIGDQIVSLAETVTQISGGRQKLSNGEAIKLTELVLNYQLANRQLALSYGPRPSQVPPPNDSETENLN